MIRVRISAGLLGPEAHQDEFSTFNRGVVGSTPTRPTKGLPIVDCGLRKLLAARAIAEQHSIGNRQSKMKERPAKLRGRSTRSVIERWRVRFPPRAFEVIVMAKILPVITAGARDRDLTRRLKAVARKLAVIRRKSRRGSIAQTAERRSHKSVAGGSIPPRAI